MKAPAPPERSAYWGVSPDQLLTSLGLTDKGLSADEAEKRLQKFGPNVISEPSHTAALRLFLNQFKSPLVLILIFAAIVSLGVGEWTSAIIVLVVVFGSTILSFVQEYRASNAVQKLRAQVTINSTIVRGGQWQTIPSRQVVPGDIVILSAGNLIPADGVVLSAKDFFVNQAVLTGETFPVEKIPGAVLTTAGLAERTNCAFMGTSAASGTAQLLVMETGRASVFGQIAEKLRFRPSETEFERGIRRFGNLLTQVMFVMVVIVLAANVFLKKPVIDSLLFSLALAVGLTPELLPAIISLTLSRGAQRMAKHGVIVRRLNSIENLGSMDVMCTDKTGTLTEGVVQLDGALGVDGQPSALVLRYAFLNAYFQTGFSNPLDVAIRNYVHTASTELETSIATETKLDEIPYDFVRKRLSVVSANAQGQRLLVTKGALGNVLSICDSVAGINGVQPLNGEPRAAIDQQYSAWSEKGFRVLGVATKVVDSRTTAYTRADEAALVFSGFLLFFDPPKADVQQVVADLAKRGVQLKIITGDNEKVARHVADAVQLPVSGVLTGAQLNELRDEALWNLAPATTIFAAVDPNQKERIILALQKSGHVVGYMGDGINDAPALHAADVGISVNTAVDVAKDAADFVLLNADLRILREGIDEGRLTFSNTLKYILTTVSANFGNMFSMAGASLLLPFLPLLAPQILLNNFLADIPATTIADDNVDAEVLAKPRRWNMKFIRDYMVLFGLVSSAFDYLTFAVLLYVFHAAPVEFRTGWFIESLLTELVIALVVRTRHLFFQSRPGKMLLVSTVVMIGITLVMPYLPFVSVFGFVPLPAPLMFVLLALTAGYVVAAEFTKKFFYGRLKYGLA